MNKLFNPNKLLLQELKDIAYSTPMPLRWAMVWFLLWLEPKYVDYKARKAVDDAVKEYNKLCDFCEEWRSEPSVKIIPSEVEGLNDMSISYDTDSDKDPTCDI
jgi:hypothetical protein|tara:strand:+ start:60 stop:368 length:309 start_codon:yes stop_codon:yes gene_type:complete